MDEQRRIQEYATWRQALADEEAGLSDNEYTEVMRAADELLQRGIITSEDWREMREEADAAHSHAMERLGRE